MSEEQKFEYKNTLNLPKTNFKMRANAAVKEVETQKYWEEYNIYEKGVEQRINSPKFLLHDGPPYLSSNKIHIGTALNKILKDIVIKYKTQAGFYSPYVPGYDGHGLPIENAVVKSLKGGRESVSPHVLRKKCREFALKNLKGQEKDFKRLGVCGDWEHPYVTINPEFEATQVRVFGQLHKNGYVYKGLKPVYWCADCETALAEAEVEYADHISHSIYVKFQLEGENANKVYQNAKLNIDNPLYMVIWTTTPWTLPANLAIAVHPKLEYVLVQKNDQKEVYIVGKDLLGSFTKDIGWEEDSYKLLYTTTGDNLEYLKAKHPLYNRESLVILGEHVTTEAGTGAVHTAPGHGLEDYEVGNKYKVGILSPVNDKGVFTEEAGKFEGLRYNKANKIIVEELKEINALLARDEIQHSYPHCWRCKHPVIYRATEQWFVDVEAFRDKALKAIDDVQWIPANNHQRIYNMVESRSDWCISRQRAWGVPIPVFYCKKCNESIISDETIKAVADLFDKESSDAWTKYSATEILPEGFNCTKCSSSELKKETDIMDVWFDSGITHAAVLDARKDQLKGSPAEMYLEGSDQHRGWFQSSLLTSISTKGEAPYKSVLTHGFVLDGNGRKMSKSVGNVVDPQNIVSKYGADVLRLWVASVDYTHDVKIGENIIQQLVEIYKKVRNTSRFLLGNLFDFDPAQDRIEYSELYEIDKYALHKLQILVQRVTEAFNNYEFYKYYQLLQNFAAVDLSSFYLDIVKDRLYTAGKKSVSRRACQTVLNETLQVLTRLLVPVTPHLAEDIWKYIPEAQKGNIESVLLTEWPKVNENCIDEAINTKWNEILKLREIVTKAIEPIRADKKIGSSLETAVYIDVKDNVQLKETLASSKQDLAMIFITSQANILEGGQSIDNALNTYEEDGYTIYVVSSKGDKCERCWKFSETIGANNEHSTICEDCISAIQGLENVYLYKI